MRQAVRHDGVEALEIEQRLDETVGRRIAIDGRDDVGAEHVGDTGLGFERVGVGLADQFAGHVRMVQPLGDAMNDGRFQRVVMQDG